LKKQLRGLYAGRLQPAWQEQLRRQGKPGLPPARRPAVGAQLRLTPGLNWQQGRST
jgi:hypothetical protein